MHRTLTSCVIGVAGALVLASCSSAPRFRSTPTEPDPTEPVRAEGGREDVVEYAKSFLGTPYRNGGSTREGVDCSGFVRSVYERFAVRLPRTSSAQSRVGLLVDRPNVAPGDLVFFRTSGVPVSHVGIYIGSGQFIHASTSARRVRIDAMEETYYRNRFVTARRVAEE
jgi:cell wall-associated NlpC family hydrolase